MRKREFWLILMIAGILFLGFGLSFLSTKYLFLVPSDVLLLGFILMIMFLIAHAVNRMVVPLSSPVILPIAAFLSGLGLMLIFRLDNDKAALQLLWIGMGLAAFIFTLLIYHNYSKIKQYKYVSGLAGIILMLSPIFFGITRGGSKLWLDFGFFKFQPAELAKILLVLFFAGYLEEKKELLSSSAKKVKAFFIPRMKHLGPLVLFWAISLLVLVFERDLGSSLLFFGLFITMLYIATGRATYLMIGSVLFVLGALGTYYVFDHAASRIDMWLNPWADPRASGYQMIQSLFAIGNGGMAGTGLGLGYPGLIPAVETDFIFAAVAEELGLFGAISIIIVYILVIYQGVKIALKAPDDFSKLLAIGLTTIFGLQSFLIVGGVTKLVPLTGVTLPFMSYGGSSVLANFILFALLLVISNRVNYLEVKESHG
ncbi:MAG TPA: FtsW/RodA/SpoVE family cell cycle protein [Actinobacteria bacterium]|nr:FtsW/RodA/SpoVE family cell cycle protein [Actinomycetota bacterium]